MNCRRKGEDGRRGDFLKGMRLRWMSLRLRGLSSGEQLLIGLGFEWGCLVSGFVGSKGSIGQGFWGRWHEG
jgi:hypothetical protein